MEGDAGGLCVCFFLGGGGGGGGGAKMMSEGRGCTFL